MKKILFTTVVFLSILILSCENEQHLSFPSGDSNLLSKIIIEGELYKEFSYNADNIITEEKTKYSYTSHTYNRNNQLIESEYYYNPAMYSSNSSVIQAAESKKEWTSPENTAKSLTQHFEYDGTNHLIKRIYVRPSVTTIDYSVFIWENNRISEQIMYHNNVKSGYIKFYYDAKGNIIKQTKRLITDDGSEDLGTTTEYEYDNMKNPYYSFRNLTSPGIYTNPNNIIKETYTILFEVDPFIDKVQITETTYDYNDRGYPVRENRNIEFIYR